jgi:hypothetical protein
MRALRWLLILPAALLAMVAVALPIHWAALLLWHQNGFLHFIDATTLERLGRSAFVPCAAILAGSYTAPGYRFRVSIALAALVAVAVPLAVAFVTRSDNLELTDLPGAMVLKAVLLAASIAYGVYTMWKSER